jgi:glutathione S-transferase
MYAPVVTRFLTWKPEISPETRAYCDAVRAYPLVADWYDAAAAEPDDWLLPDYETVA